ncbi:MAG TPA: cytochrome c oxidase subunit 3 [Candidatus Acidoferrum sp.]|nr:cytochrome c oxidase subunit 3 [Candidatus Acidoferrum sp.]
MPAATSTKEIELIIETVGGGGGGSPPANGGRGGGDGDGKPGRNRKQPSPNRYYTGIAVALISILMFFMALASAFLVRKGTSGDWVAVHIPVLLWFNSAVLLLSSTTLEIARKRLANNDLGGFKKLWFVTTTLGVIFLLGQLVAWRQLNSQGIYLATNPASSFFYIFTGAHALHLVGGVAALIYVARRNFDVAKVTRSVAAEVTSYYWHFMDALWLFLLALLYLGK